MIIAKSPLRISIGGGGTDLPSYYRFKKGYLISAAIDKYVYVTITKPFSKGIYLKYSKIEKTNYVNQIKHPIIRETLKTYDKVNQIEITTLADIPAGTGLGSSGSFTTSLIKALNLYFRINQSEKEIAEKAFEIEAIKLKQPVGKQDQYVAAYGGINEYIFEKNNSVIVNKLNITDETSHVLEENLLIFFTGFSRSSSSILTDQNTKSLKKNKDITKNLDYIKDLGIRIKFALEKNNLEDFGKLLDEHWLRKKNRFNKMSNSKIDKWYDIAKANGAIGGKLVGAGGGGFLMFYANDKLKLRKAMNKIGLSEVRFKFDFQGARIV
jgi:D-glycero-alpha-D-manno-heptose-7-phosphate kinase